MLICLSSLTPLIAFIHKMSWIDEPPPIHFTTGGSMSPPQNADSVLAVPETKSELRDRVPEEGNQELRSAEEALQNLVAGTAAVTGEEFFPALVRHLAIALGVRMAVVTECTDKTFAKARVLSRWKDDQWDGGFEYSTDNTPCSRVLNGGRLCYYPDHVQDHFPGNEFLPAFGAACYLGAPLFDTDAKQSATCTSSTASLCLMASVRSRSS